MPLLRKLSVESKGSTTVCHYKCTISYRMYGFSQAHTLYPSCNFTPPPKVQVLVSLKYVYTCTNTEALCLLRTRSFLDEFCYIPQGNEQRRCKTTQLPVLHQHWRKPLQVYVVHLWLGISVVSVNNAAFTVRVTRSCMNRRILCWILVVGGRQSRDLDLVCPSPSLPYHRCPGLLKIE